MNSKRALAAIRFRRLNSLQKLSFVVLASSALLAPRIALAGNDAFDTNPTASGGVANFSGNFTVGTTTPAAGGTGTPASGDALYFGTSSTMTLNDDLAAGTVFAGLFFNSGASAFTIGGNDFTLSSGIINNSASNETINDNLTLSANQTWLGGTASGTTLTLGGSVTGAGINLTTNGGTGGPQVNSNTVFTGAVSLGSLLAQGNASNGNNFGNNPTTTFNGNSSLTTTGNVVIGRSNVTFTGNAVANIAGSITNANAASADWATVTISGSANVTTASLNMAGNGVTGLFTLNGGTLTTGSIASVDSSDGSYPLRNLLNGTQIIASQSNATFLNVVQGSVFSGSNEVFVGNGGALFNSNGFNIGTATAFHNNSGATGILTKSGAGTLTMSGASDYTGATTINAGTLNLTGSLTSAVTVNPGGALSGYGNGSSTGKISGNLSVSGGGALTLAQATASTPFTLAGALTLGGTGGYGAGQYSTLNFTLGGGVEALNASGALTLNSGGGYINLTGATTNGTYNLLTFSSQTGTGTFSLSSTTAGVTTATVGRSTYTLLDNTTSLQLQVSAPAAPGVAYFNGAVSNKWNDLSNANVVNFSNNLAGTTDAGYVPGATTDVILNASNATTNRGSATLTETLGVSTAINSLSVNGNGATTIAADGSTLTINALADSNTASDGSYTGNTAGTGISIASGANAFTISVPVALGNSQTWTNNSGNLFTVGGTSVTGTATTGTQTLTLANTSTGGTTISSAIGDGGLGGSLALTVNNTGTGATILTGANTYTGGTTITAGTLQINGTGVLGSGNIADGGALVFNTSTSQTLGGVISGAGTLTQSGSGTLTLSNANNSLSGAISINAGILAVSGGASITSLGTSAISLNNGGTLQLSSSQGGGTVTLANALTVSGAATFSLTNGGNPNFKFSTLTLSNGSAVTLTSTGYANLGANTTILNGNASITDQVFSGDHGAFPLLSDVTVGNSVATGTVSVFTLNNTNPYSGISGVISDNSVDASKELALVKNGSGTLTLSNSNNSFSGNLTINGGVVNANAGTGSSSTSDLGSIVAAGRQIIVNSGGTLNLLTNNVLANSGTVASSANMVTLAINGGTVFSSDYNRMGNIVLSNGGTLDQKTTQTYNSYRGYQFYGNVTVNLGTGGNTAASTISQQSGATGGDSLSPGGSTLFTVADATGNANADLIVSATLMDSPEGTSTAGLTKAGAGTMALTAANTYTGATTVNAGTLSLNVANALARTNGITVNNSGSTLALAASNALANPGATTSTTAGSPASVGGQVSVTLGGGALLRNGTGVSLGSQSGTSGTVGIGSLTLTAASTLNFGTTGVGTLNFNGFADGNNSLLTVLNYTHSTSGAGVDGTDDRLIFNQDMTNFLGDFSINGVTPTEVALGNGEFELTVTAVPEPATWAAGFLCVAALGYHVRWRLSRAGARGLQAV